MRLLRHLTCCFPITKTQIWKSNEKILIEKNNFLSNKRSHLVPNASYVNKHDWFDATPISCIHRWFDWNYNILLLELINSNNNKCIVEFSTWKPIVIAFVSFSSSFLSFSFFFNQKRVFRDYQSLGFKADGLSISIWKHFPRESRAFHDFRSLQRWSTWTLNLVTWRIIGWNQAVLEQRAGVSRKTKAWPVLGFYTHTVALATTLWGQSIHRCCVWQKRVHSFSLSDIETKMKRNFMPIWLFSNFQPIWNVWNIVSFIYILSVIE